MQERLQKFLARSGVTSRRKAEELILQGKVKVNNEVVNILGTKIDAEKDNIYVENKIIKPEESKVYIALYKPTGYISSVSDDRGRKTILDIVNVQERIFPIGRLDYDTSGLILLTNDGEVYNRVIHPRSEIDKVYLAKVKGKLIDKEINVLSNGVDIGGYITREAKVKIIDIKDEFSTISITIHEGKNRQVRKMCEKVSHPVISLMRKSIGKIGLEGLKIGQWRNLTNQEVDYLKSL